MLLSVHNSVFLSILLSIAFLYSLSLFSFSIPSLYYPLVYASVPTDITNVSTHALPAELDATQLKFCFVIVS